MPRLIDADAMLEYLEKHHCDDWLLNQYNADWIASWIESQPTIEAEPQWIPVTEKPPEESDADKDGRVFAVLRGEVPKVWHWSIVCDYPTSFTHWMPMPKPPKADE